MSPEDTKSIKQAVAVINDTIKAALASSSPELKEEILKELQQPMRHGLPEGWSENSTASYYKKEYAEQVKKHLEKFLENPGLDLVLFSTQFRCATNTLYQQIIQGFMYLRDRMEETNEQYPEGKYKKLREELMVAKERGKIRICRKPIQEIASELVGPRKKERQWKTDLQDWIEKAQEDEKIELKNQTFSGEDIEWIEALLNGLDCFHVIKQTKSSLTICKKSGI